MNKKGGVLFTVRDDSISNEIVDVARKYDELGFALYATEGTARALEAVGLTVHHTAKVSDGAEENTVSLMEEGKISYVISTDSKGPSAPAGQRENAPQKPWSWVSPA